MVGRAVIGTVGTAVVDKVIVDCLVDAGLADREEAFDVTNKLPVGEITFGLVVTGRLSKIPNFLQQYLNKKHSE